ncbi:SH3 domain-containing protein [Streptomyces sp. NPDC048650]|uniref:SH3 domain-containing protein n=1 Tax=Streptomyces sp. NPDC048650 TaxID=3365583 RepID=UPI003718DB5C
MSTQDHQDYLDLDAIVGSLDDSADGSADGSAGAGTKGGTKDGAGFGPDAGPDVDGEGGAPAVLAATRRSFRLAPGYKVKVRRGPSTTAAVVRQLADGAWIEIRCQRRGQRVSGPYGTTDIWDNIAPGQYVSDAYVRTGSSGPVAPRCTS